MSVLAEIKHLIYNRLFKTSRDIEINRFESVIDEIDDILHILQQLNNFCDINSVLQLVKQARSVLEGHLFDTHIASTSFGISVPVSTHEGTRGRPNVVIPEDTLYYYVCEGFTSSSIANFLGVSQSTIKRRLNLYGIKIRSKYTDIPDADLNEKVKEILQQFPNIGAKSVTGHLVAQGYRAQQWRVRQALRQVDPAGVLLRRLSLHTINRRKYSVRAPQALWHIDGYHKLIRWRMVIHGGIDGFSRLIVYLNIANNNRSKTVLRCFKTACEQTGIPERVRSDKGGENVLVADHMLRNRGRGSHLTGRSVHNQRIERLWRELWNGCIAQYYCLFCQMEDQLLLEATDDTNLLALHHVFLPRIQRSLDQFVASFINRPMRTEHGNTPKQLWISGRLVDHLSASFNVVEDLDFYGVDDEGPEPTDVEETVVVPIMNCSEETVARLSQVNSLQPSDTMGVDIYLQALNILQTH